MSQAITHAATNGQVPTKTLGPRAYLLSVIEGRIPAMRAVASKYLTPEKLIKMFGVEMVRNPKLALCSGESVLDSAMNLAELGLKPGFGGEAYLIPFQTKTGWFCQLIIGYKGYIKIAARSGINIDCHLVYKGDTFELEYGSSPKLIHKPNLDSDPGDADIIGAYTVATGGMMTGPKIEFMTRKQLIGIKNKSKASGSGPWVDHFAEMCRKTVVRRAFKYLPLDSDEIPALAEAEAKEFNAGAFEDGGEEAPKRGADALVGRIEAAKTEAPRAEEPGAPEGDLEPPYVEPQGEPAAEPATPPKPATRRGSKTGPLTEDDIGF